MQALVPGSTAPVSGSGLEREGRPLARSPLTPLLSVDAPVGAPTGYFMGYAPGVHPVVVGIS